MSLIVAVLIGKMIMKEIPNVVDVFLIVLNAVTVKPVLHALIHI